jgi:hypothetical protein
MLLTLALLLFACAEANAQCTLTLQDPAGGFPASAQDAVKVAFTLNAPCDSAGNVRVQVSAPVGAIMSNPINELSAAHDYVLSINLFRGANTVTIVGLNAGTLTPVQTWSISCAGRWCNAPLSLAPASVVGAVGAAPAAAPAAATNKITIDNPTVPSGKTAYETNKSAIDSYVTVTQGSGINRIQYDVIHDGKVAFTSDPINVNYPAASDAKVPITLKVLKGLNTIRIYDTAHPGGGDDATVPINCTGDNCATDFLVATIPTNSRFTRAIVGMEQAGASSAESKVNPFLDFFFTTPLLFTPMKEFVQVIRKDSHGNPVLDANNQPVKDWVRKTAVGPDGQPLKAPTFGAWGQVRFSTTPEQISSFAVFPSNFVNQVSDPTKAVDLVKSFDFLAGLEYRAFNANGWIWTLIPGVKQRTSVYFTFGGGAISPLTVKRESAQLFIVPVAPDPRRAEFIRRFGDPQGLTYVGFVPLERDRFFRQYYAGIRLKTHYCEDPDCNTYKNRFPSIVDFGIGQNEAVTGGRLKSEVRDSANNIIAHRRAWVARVDAFFPLPFREANFLYLYGTALMKIGGGGGVKIQTPLFLDTPTSTIQITDPGVYIPPPDLQPTRTDRDYYKIGIGVNLTDLFNRNKPKP